ncbi:PREDICTED: uncharacterized protein LOC109231587 [Nicotiana attenuata]|uniref:uncharacterized protein LOC109231587 n=1 Tax=Nicotiana attenuata TaxID=49451 RepID=UPI0009048358|nr:PREDICTED: uncharacterized protein LOC109231587 [Nicotiana attenuata]
MPKVGVRAGWVSLLDRVGASQARGNARSTRCMLRNSLRTGELLEALSNPEKIFKALNRANKRGKQQQNSKEQIEPDMDDRVENPNNRNNENDPNNQDVVPLERREAQTWVNSLPTNSITTWDELVKQFLNKFYPPNKIAKQIDDILSFRQRLTKSLQETWERFKDMLVKCPHHGIPDQMLGQMFYMGLADGLKANVDASAGGAFLSKTFRECKILLDKMAQNSGWMTRDSTITPVVHSVALDPNNSIAENMATLMTQMSILTKKIDESGQKQQVHIVDATNRGLCTHCIDQPYVCSWSAEGEKQQYQEDMNYVTIYGGQRQGGQNWGQQNQQYRPAQQQYNNSNNHGAMRPQGQVVPYQRQQGYNQQNQQLAYQQPQQQQIVRQDDGFGKLKGMLNNNNRMLQQLIGSIRKMQERVDSHE